MGRAKQAIHNEVQHATNTTAPAQPNLAPSGLPPMVLQNPLPVQGLVETKLFPQTTPASHPVPHTMETRVHQLLVVTAEEINLQTR